MSDAMTEAKFRSRREDRDMVRWWSVKAIARMLEKAMSPSLSNMASGVEKMSSSGYRFSATTSVFLFTRD